MDVVRENRKDNSEEEIDLVQLLYNYLKYWKWFLTSILLFSFIGCVVLLILPKQYEPSLSILLNEDSAHKSNNSDLLDLGSLGLLSTTNNIENEILVLQSPDLMKEVVKAIGCNVSYSQKQLLRNIEIYDESPFVIDFLSNIEDYDGFLNLEVQKKGNLYLVEGQYLLGEDKLELEYLFDSLPRTILVSEDISIRLELSGKELEEDKKYFIKVDNLLSSSCAFTKSLTVSNAGKKSSVLQLSILVNNTKKGIDILNELVRQYNALNLKLNNEIAYNTSLFINDRLKDISTELSDAEEGVVEYKQQHKITNLSSEAQLFVSQTGENELKLLEIETQLNVLKFIQGFLDNPNNYTSIIPNMGISDVGLSKIISEYNNMLLSSNQLIIGTGEKNPTRTRVISELENMRNGITNSLENVRATYEVSKQELEQRGNKTNLRIHSVPKQEKGLLEKVREQKVKENLFLFLMQKREETNLSIAATADKARTIISARLNLLPVSPKSKIILLAFIAFGIILPAVIIFVRDLFRTQISNRDELERLSEVPIIGEIGYNETKLPLVTLEKQHIVTEMFRSLRNNIRFISNNQLGFTILVTSTMASEGKSFISINLGIGFASAGKRVLIIGGDIRKPRIHEYLKDVCPQRDKGLSNFLITENAHIEEYLSTPFVDMPNLQVLFAGTIPPNPNELLMSDKLHELLLDLKEKYDYIIFDSAPVGLVSDSYLIAQYSDLTLYVVRENKTPKSALNFINAQFIGRKFNNMYLVLNETELETSYKYGYGKGYGYK